MDRHQITFFGFFALALLSVQAPGGCAGLNHGPDLAPLAALTVTVGETLSVVLAANDPDGDPVRFEVSGAPEGARVEPDQTGQWHFTYSPLASHAGPDGKTYDLLFTALDDRGGETGEATTLTVLPEGSVPTFTGPFAWTLNLAEDDHLTAMIHIRDDDTATLELSLVKGVDGAVFGIVDGHTASLYWKPRPLQIDEGPVFTFTVVADDGSHPKVFADFAVVLVNSEMFGGCPGTPPTATHQPVSDQHGVGDYPLTLQASDMESVIGNVKCQWSAVKGTGESDMNMVTLGPAGGDSFSGFIPNLSAAAGAGRILYYHFLVSDDDDQTSDYCDHAVRVPKVGEFAFAVYGPEHPGTCLGDIFGDPQGSPPQLPDGTLAALRLCNGVPDVFTKLLVQGEGLAVVARPMSASAPLLLTVEDPFGATIAQSTYGTWVTAPVDGEYKVRVSPADNQPVTYELSTEIAITSCQPDFGEPNQTPETATPLNEGPRNGTICPADTDFYGFQLDGGEAAALTLTFVHEEADLDLTLFEAGSSVPIRMSATNLGTEELVVETPFHTEYVLMIRSSGPGSTSYVLDLVIEEQEVLCEDDLFSPNQVPQQAPILYEATYNKLKLCPGKVDYLATQLNGGEDLTAWVEVTPGLEAPAMTVLMGDGQTVLATGEAAGEVVTANVVVPGPGNILIRTGPVTDQAVNYSLGFFAKDPPGPCNPDRLEPNDLLETASSVAQGITPHLTLCPGDTDLFTVKMGAWQTIAAYLLFGSVAVHIDLLNSDNEIVTTGSPAQYGEELFFLTQETGTYYLQVRDSAGGQGWYDIAIQTE